MLASVMEGKVDQHVLDGKDMSVKIPAVLLERMEKLSHQVSQEMHYFNWLLTSCTLTGHFDLQFQSSAVWLLRDCECCSLTFLSVE